MKKMAIAAVLALVSVSALAELRIGTVDMLKLVRNHKSYDSNRLLLSSTEKDNLKKLDEYKTEGEKLQLEGRQLAEQMRNPMLSDGAKTDIEKQLMEIQQKLAGIEQRYRADALRYRQDLQDLEVRMLKATTADLHRSIESFAKSKGYDLIVDASAVPYAKASCDVTPGVLKEMGVDPATAKDAVDAGK